MRKQIRLWLVLIALPLLFTCFVSCSSTQTEPTDTSDNIFGIVNDVDNFIYVISQNEIHITGYSGIDPVINIPSEIGSLPVTVIKENAFKGFLHLESVSIPDTVKTMNGAFKDCPDLKTVHIGSSVVEMNEAFSGCTKLKTVTGLVNATYMDSAFYGCSSLMSAIIPKSAKSALSAFEGCTSLVSATIEEGITCLDKTFLGCSYLSKITIPESVGYLISAFEDCTALKSISGGTGAFVYNRAFYGCMRLEKITLGDNVKELISAFVGCTSLNSIENLPVAVEKYSPSFSDCSSLTDVVIPAISDEEYLSKYSPTKDLDGCTSLKTVKIFADYTVREEFCKAFADLSSLQEMTVTDAVLEKLLRVTYTYTDKVYEGDDSKIATALKNCKKAGTVRVTDNYTRVDGKMFSRIYGGDVYPVDPDVKAKETPIVGFTPFDVTTYWCGYPSDGNRKDDSVAVERVYSFLLRTSGRNNSALPERVTVNGFSCIMGE